MVLFLMPCDMINNLMLWTLGGFETTRLLLVVSNPPNIQSIKLFKIKYVQINIYVDVCFHSSIQVKRSYKLCAYCVLTYFSIDHNVVSIGFAGVTPPSTVWVLATVSLNCFFHSSPIGVSLEINPKINIFKRK